MTGIGFLGAGVILKEGASIRGLTTAASIWITAVVGIAIGSGKQAMAFLTVALTLVTLVMFRWIENRFPGHRWALLTVRLSRSAGFRELALQDLIRESGAWAKESGYHVESGGNILICEMNVHTRKRGDFYKLAEALKNAEWVRDFNLTIASR
jgi:putative Mg2+ transporter-C (MgtC) family protein